MNSLEKEATAQLLHQGNHLALWSLSGWELATRTNAKGAVCILPVTHDQEIVLVEQYRPPVGKNVIELPAGLAGDIPLQRDEPLLAAAQRELKEETGYEAKVWKKLAEGPSSAGLTDEVITFFYATQMTRMTMGGGDSSENIRVHHVPIAETREWCQQCESKRVMVDFKIYAALHLMREIVE